MSARLVSGEQEIELKPSGEEGILLIKSLCGLDRVVSNVNIPNTNLQIPNLPRKGQKRPGYSAVILSNH